MTARPLIARRERDEIVTSLRELAALGARLGGIYAPAATLIADRLDRGQQGRNAARDEAIRELAEHVDAGSMNARAAEIARRLRIYANGAWRRGEGAMSSPPAVATGTEREWLWHALNASGGAVPSARTIRRTLAAHAGQKSTAVLANARAHHRLNQREATVRHEQVIDILSKTPEFQKAQAAQRAQIVAQRKARLDEIERLDAEAAKAWPRQERAKAEAAAAEKSARDSYVEAQRRHRALVDTVSRERMAFDNERRDHELALIAGAADYRDTLAAFREHCEAEIETTTKAVVWRDESALNPVSRQIDRRRIGNGASVAARLDAIRGTLRDIGDLLLLPDLSEIPAKIEAIKASWPTVETLKDSAA